MAAAVLWLFRLIKGWLPRVLGAAASLAFIIWGVSDGDVWEAKAWLFWTGVGLAVVAFISEFLVQRPSYMRLSQLREEAERKALMKSEALERALEIMLAQLASYCGLESHSDRMSVYHFHEDTFFLVARIAKNPALQARGRNSYPMGQGAIGRAWDEEAGLALVNMPTGSRWRSAAIKQGFPAEVADGMRMKSLGLGAYRLEADGRSVGVLVVESKNAGRIKQTHLDKIADSHIVAAIAELAAAFALMTPAGETFAATSSPPRRPWQSVPPRAPVTS
ncbi:hypothetical protein ABCS02_10695 [Microbacterium sp. X-17]|uniref:hypothetical protein n=1 Tax=Microbacterium sp. X-17 TaxID=3144404 RepID=UPI0031F5BFE7